jgi:mono/diheme cytochrome c family protein
MTRQTGITVLLVSSMFAAVAAAQEKPPAQKQPPKQPSEARKSSAAAKALEQYSFTCQPCHGPDGKGVLPGTDLTSGKWKHGSTLAAIAKTISEGVPGTAMLPAKDRFSKAEILELARLTRSFDKTRSGRKPPVKK